MKRFILSLIVILGLVSCETKNDNLSTSLVNNPSSADGVKSGSNAPAIRFETTEYDFGKVLQGEQVSHTFKFKNVGDAPLIISSIEKTCGCTTPDFSSQPIKPGESGKITVTYDSKGHKGFQNKRLIVKANTNPSETILRIKAQVENINTF
jgi:hypothetical protein